MFLSRVLVVSDYYLFTEEDLVAFIKWLQNQDINRGSPVIITNSSTKSFIPYRSIAAVAKDMALSWTTINNAIKNNSDVNNCYTFHSIYKEQYLLMKFCNFIGNILLNKNILGFVLSEATGLFALMISFLLLYS